MQQHNVYFYLLMFFLPGLVSCSNSRREQHPDYQIELLEAGRGEDPDFIWTQARTAKVAPVDPPYFLMTLSQKLRKGADVYYDLYQMVSKDQGRTWSKPEVIPSLKIHDLGGGYRRSMSDMTPQWHPQTQKVINIGKAFYYLNEVELDRSRRGIAYAVYDPATKSWGSFHELELPEIDADSNYIVSPVAGCVQYHVEENGDILLPVFYYPLSSRQKAQIDRETFEVENFMANQDISHATSVVRCSFDGEQLEFKEQGNILSIGAGRGLYEPSIVKFRQEFLMTLRADASAYVARSADGMHFNTPVDWRFDDGNLLGSYNTQQHWLTNDEKLYLVYTRKGADNDHIFRHRAPLFMAEVDPGKLVVIKATERIVVPEAGAPLGNFGITRIDQQESWVTSSEYPREEKAGNRNRILIARITWE